MSMRIGWFVSPFYDHTARLSETPPRTHQPLGSPALAVRCPFPVVSPRAVDGPHRMGIICANVGANLNAVRAAHSISIVDFEIA